MEGTMADQFAINPYAPPKSNVEVSSHVTTVEAFPRFSAWWVLLLTVATVGIYPLYWLYTRTRILNCILPSRAIPIGLAVAAAGLLAADCAGGFVKGIYPDDLAVRAMSTVIGLSLNVVNLVWVFMLRNRLNEHFVSHRGDRYWLGGVLTFFFQVLYLQYKLNQLIDRETAADPRAADVTARRDAVPVAFDAPSLSTIDPRSAAEPR
jgi:Domain of unknown function (DUF4234)